MQGWSERACPEIEMLIVPNWSIIAVLFLAACFFPRISCQLSQSRSSRSQEADELASVEAGSRWLTPKEAQEELRRAGGERMVPADCCPSILEMVEPQGGIGIDGGLVELFKEAGNKQRFYELSCVKGVEGKPCRFLDRHLHNQSKCVQKYSYTYALVREQPSTVPRPLHFPSFPSGGSNWMLDYIRVRSGCSCEVTPKVKRKHPKSKRTKIKRTDYSEEET